jgi:predicted DNA-binding transcriptional regulator YafY
MNRIDRLVATLIHLQSKRIVKAKEIAERFDISLRTVYRDIRALEDAGVPIGAEAGKGYFIVEGYHLPPVMFTREEAAALILGEKLVEKFTDASIQTNFQASLLKIKSVLSSGEKEYLERLGGQIEVLSALPGKGTGNHLLTEIQGHLGSGRVIRIQYHSAYKDETTHRDIEPLVLCFYASRWHLLAYCRMRRDYRDFRVDRVKQVIETKTVFDRAGHPSMKVIVKRMVLQEEVHPAVVLFEKRVARFIGEMKYYHGFVEEREVGGRIEMDFLTNSYDWLARWLLTLLDGVEVVHPKALTKRLQRFTDKLYTHYHG